MEKPLEPPPRVFDPYRPRDRFIARVTNTAPLEKPDPFAGCKNPSDVLQRLLDNEDSELKGNFLLTKL